MLFSALLEPLKRLMLLATISLLQAANVRCCRNNDFGAAIQQNDAMCQSRPTHRSKEHPYSITSSASASSVGGMTDAGAFKVS